MKAFFVWIARQHLRPKFSGLWVIVCMILAFSTRHIGAWAFLWMIVSVIPVAALEVWWNDYADDYSDLE